MLNNILKLKSFVLQKWPNLNVVSSKAITRSHSEWDIKIVEINKRLCYFDITMTDNNNVSKSKSLHLNSKNILQFA